MKKYILHLFLPARFYWALTVCIFIFILSYYFSWLFPFAKILTAGVLLLTIVDYCMLFFFVPVPKARRRVNERLSNGDENSIKLWIKNTGNVTLYIQVIDELPFQFQSRDFSLHAIFKGRQEKELAYKVKPLQRGEYEFGNILLFLRTMLALVERRVPIEAQQEVKVYPSFVNLGSQQLLSGARLPLETGNRQLRKIGQSMEFEQVKDYVAGDDIRTINWKATARKGGLMVNSYVDEKSQQIYCIVDKGRLMKMPFAGLSLLDYSINAVLALSNVCIHKQDKVGLISFSNKMGTMLPADRKLTQRENIMQALYKEQTGFLECDFEMLYMQVRKKLKQRSLLMLFTNFETLSGLNRQINYLRSIARHHLLLVVFFENTELQKVSMAEAHNVDDVYVKTIAEKFLFEKKLIAKELKQYGILCLHTTPENLSVNAINKYLELKAKQAL